MTARPVRIAGAGPSGLCAALLLARAGVRVELREKRPVVGHRFRGAVHGIENWSSPEPFTERLAAWGVDLGATATPCHELWLCDERRLRPLRCSAPLFYLVRRGPDPDCLEGTLLRLAREAGASVRLGACFDTSEVEIDATGPSSTRRVCAEAGIHFRTSAPDLAAALVTRRATPRGYAYLLVRAGVGSLCVVRFDGEPVAREHVASCRALLSMHLRSRRISLDVHDAKAGAGFGALHLHGHFGDPTRWAVGERAGLQDMLWGFGIRRALESAALAARCRLGGAAYPSVAARALDVPDRAALVNRCLWDHTAALGLPAYAGLLGRSGDVRSALRRATRERRIHRALYPLALWWLQRRFAHLGASDAEPTPSDPTFERPDAEGQS